MAVLLALLAAATTAAAPPNSQVERGGQVAQQRCAVCHAVGETDRSRNGAAPPFRALARRGNVLGLEASLKRIAKNGHFEMRPTALSATDSDDLAAYIASLDKPKR